MSFPDKTPPINAQGKYILRTPWYIDPTVSYKCEAIMGFEAAEERNIDVFASYYEPNNLSQNEFNADRKRGINIVTLMSGAGPTIYVPSSYIIYYPGDTSTSYGRLIVAVDLGPLPEDYPLSDLQSAMASMAVSFVGNANITTSVHVIPMKGFMDAQLASNLAESRFDKMVNTITPYLSKIVGEKDLQKAQTKIAGLEELIKG